MVKIQIKWDKTQANCSKICEYEFREKKMGWDGIIWSPLWEWGKLVRQPFWKISTLCSYFVIKMHPFCKISISHFLKEIYTVSLRKECAEMVWCDYYWIVGCHCSAIFGINVTIKGKKLSTFVKMIIVFGFILYVKTNTLQFYLSNGTKCNVNRTIHFSNCWRVFFFFWIIHVHFVIINM